jgi:hypothetical protein
MPRSGLGRGSRLPEAPINLYIYTEKAPLSFALGGKEQLIAFPILPHSLHELAELLHCVTIGMTLHCCARNFFAFKRH